MKEPRCVEDVLKQIVVIVPPNETLLLEQLNKFYYSLDNKAPELRSGPDCWVPLIDILNYFIPNKDDAEWKKQLRILLLNE
jgi:hypothetical protein